MAEVVVDLGRRVARRGRLDRAEVRKRLEGVAGVRGVLRDDLGRGVLVVQRLADGDPSTRCARPKLSRMVILYGSGPLRWMLTNILSPVEIPMPAAIIGRRPERAEARPVHVPGLHVVVDADLLDVGSHAQAGPEAQDGVVALLGGGSSCGRGTRGR